MSGPNDIPTERHDDKTERAAHVDVDRMKLLRALAGVDCPQCRDMILDAHYAARERAS